MIRARIERLSVGSISSESFVIGGAPARPVLQELHEVPLVEILSLIRRFRDEHAPEPSATLSRARISARERFARLAEEVEWKLVEMPLPRLQVIGDRQDRFLYEIHWDKSIRRGEFSRIEFERRIQFVADAENHLVQLAGLLRPLIQRKWAAMVTRLNRRVIADPGVEEFLFGVSRIALSRLRRPLLELQGNRCFYCGSRVERDPEVDHFIPWARHPDDGIDNLVVADRRCNGDKRDFIASVDHLGRWRRERLASDAPFAAALEGIARSENWERNSERTLAVARSLYFRLPVDAKLWQRPRSFVELHPGALRAALAASAA